MLLLLAQLPPAVDPPNPDSALPREDPKTLAQGDSLSIFQETHLGGVAKRAQSPCAPQVPLVGASPGHAVGPSRYLGYFLLDGKASRDLNVVGMAETKLAVRVEPCCKDSLRSYENGELCPSEDQMGGIDVEILWSEIVFDDQESQLSFSGVAPAEHFRAAEG